jgi:hypothetical protein
MGTADKVANMKDFDEGINFDHTKTVLNIDKLNT